MKIVTKLIALMLTVSLIVFFAGCKDEDELLPQVTADFTYTINEDTGTVTFINTSTNATKFVWDFGDGETSTEINPIKTYPTGTYTVRLTATNVSGASNFIENTIVINIKLVMSLPITFDNSNVNYTPTVFSGASFAIVDNPSQTGTNNKATKVGAITNSGAAFEGVFFDLGSDIDLATNKRISMNFRASAATTVLLKLEEGTAGALEVTSNHGGTDWEKISFDFNSSAKYSRVTLFVDGPGTTAGTFYIDDIMQELVTGGGGGCTGTLIAAPSLPLDFEGCATFLPSENFGAGITSELTANPSKTGINTSNYVLKVDKPTGSDFYAGIQNTFASKFDLTTTNTFKVKVYSSKANVVFRFELALNPQSVPIIGNPAPVYRTITTANVWTEVSVTFINLPASPTSYNQLVIKPDNTETDSPITAGGTYYIDDITLSAGGVGATCVPEATENINPATGDINWTFKTNDVAHTFEAFGNTSGAIVANPVIGGINTSCNVEKFTKTAGCETWSGLGTTLSTALDFAVITKKVFKMKVLAQTQVTAVTLRLERLPFPDTEPSQDRVANITQVGEWQELTFDFSDVTSGTFKSMIIYFERNASCDGDVYYFDDIVQVAGSTPTCTPEATENINPATGDLNWTFKTNDVAHTFEAFGNTSGAIVANPVIGGINTSCNVEKFTKTAGCETWSGLGTTLSTALDFAVITKKVFKMKVLAQTQVTAVTLRLERLPFPDTEPSQDRVANITQVGVWQELTFDFSDVTSGTFKSMIIYFERNTSCDGDVYYFDDIVQVAGGGGGGSCPTPPAGEFIVDGGFEANAGCWELIANQAGTSSTIVTNVNNGGTNSARIKTAPAGNPAIKQTRFGAGVILPTTTYVVKFDVRSDAADPVAEGAVFKVAAFSEAAEGSGTGAIRHELIPGEGSVSSSWTARTLTFTTAGASNVAGGLSLLIELVGGGPSTTGTIYIDNVSLIKQ